MKPSETRAPEDDMIRAEEILLLAERLKQASFTDGDAFEECIQKVLESPENYAGVLDQLTLEAELILAQAVESASVPARVLAVARDSRAQWYPVAIAALAIGVIVAFWVLRHAGTDFVANSRSRSVQLEDRSTMTMDPRTVAKVRITQSTRNIDLRAGGADFDVTHDSRPFQVNIPLGTATALGTRFYVGLMGTPDNLEALVRVRLGSIRFESRAPHPDTQIVNANEEARVTSGGHIEITGLSETARHPTALTEFTDEPLARLAARFNQLGRGPRFDIKGGACILPITGSFNVDDPTSLIDHVDNDPRFKAFHGDDVVLVRAAHDKSPPKSLVHNGCNVELDQRPAVPAASAGTEPSLGRSPESPAGSRP